MDINRILIIASLVMVVLAGAFFSWSIYKRYGGMADIEMNTPLPAFERS